MPELLRELTVSRGLSWVAQAALLHAFATVCFDCLHWALHAAHRSTAGWLRAIGGVHHTHHRFLTTNLRFDDSLSTANLVQHRTVELAGHVLAAALGFLVLEPAPVVLVLAAFLAGFLVVTARRGRDAHHRALPVVPAPRSALFVGVGYHALHHAHPDRYFGSVLTLFDRLFGTGCQVAGRTVALTGASGAFGAPLKAILEREGATVLPLKYGVDYRYGDYAGADEALGRADILVLAHGSKVKDAMAANCDSFLALIDRFRELKRSSRFPPEVWAVGSEIECHPSWGNAELQIYLESKRAYARHARRFFHQTDFLYRHIVPSAFTSPMGKGLISGATAARWAWLFICRGFRYVPVSYSGIALLNYFKFVFRVHAAPPDQKFHRSPLQEITG